MRKNLKLSSDGGDYGSKKCKEDAVAPMVASGWSLESDGRFCVGRDLASVTVKMLAYLICFLRTFINVVLSMIFARIMPQ
jgi:hypothetical protein